MMITVSRETKSILDRIAVASGKPASRWVSEMLDEGAEAIFLPLLEALNTAKKQKSDAYQILNHALANTQHHAAQLSLEIHEEIKTAKAKERKKNATKK